MNEAPTTSMELPSADPTRAIADLIDTWANAWNAHDMERARRLLADNIDFVTVAGLWLRGSEEFLAYHRDIHRTHMRDSRWTNLAYDLRPVRDDVWLVHLEWTIAGDRDPDGTPRRRRYGLFTWLIEQRGTAWRIAAVHNGNLRVDLRHRLSGVGINPSS
jgi:uncharacterized protein (TIGR02246 family)